jgi:hypothetical protein
MPGDVAPGFAWLILGYGKPMPGASLDATRVPGFALRAYPGLQKRFHPAQTR